MTVPEGNPRRAGSAPTPSGYWRDDSVLFGFFTYRGYLDENAYRFDRIGGDVRLNYKNLSLAGGYINGNNDQTHEQKDIWFAEASILFFHGWCRTSGMRTLP